MEGLIPCESQILSGIKKLAPGSLEAGISFPFFYYLTNFDYKLMRIDEKLKVMQVKNIVLNEMLNYEDKAVSYVEYIFEN